MIKSFITSVLAAALLLAAPLAAEEKSASASHSEKAQSIFFTDSHGEKIDMVITPKGIEFPGFKGKNVIMLFYIYTGTPCRNELKLFSRLKPELDSLEFLTFELKGLDSKKFGDFEKELGLNGIHMIDSTQAIPFARYIAGQIKEWHGTVPFIIVIGKDGSIRRIQVGALSEKEIRAFAR